MDTLINIVKKSAPVLGAALGGIGAPVGMIISGLASLFGGASTEEELAAKIQADPDSYLKLREYEAQHERDLLEFVERDRNNARSKHVETVRALGKRDWVMDFLSIAPLVAVIAIAIFAMTIQPTGNEKDFFYSIFDMFSSFLAFVMGYHFGGVAPKNSSKIYFKDKK